MAPPVTFQRSTASAAWRVWVVLHNATDISMAPATGIFRALGLLTHPGWIGVQLFFALSGFLITGGLLDTQRSDHYFRDFYAKRALRILPLYYGVLFALLVVVPLIPAFSASISSEGQASLWLFTVNWTHTAPYGFAHFWSLAVEEQFYLLWPLVVWKLTARRLLMVCVWVALGALLLRCVLVGFGTDWWTLYTNTVCRMDALALGSAGACLLRIPELRQSLLGRTNRFLTIALTLFLVGIPLTHVYDRTRWAGETLGYSVLAVTCALFVAVVAMLATKPASRLTSFVGCAPLRSWENTAMPCTSSMACCTSSWASRGWSRAMATPCPLLPHCGTHPCCCWSAICWGSAVTSYSNGTF